MAPVWDAASGQELLKFSGHRGILWSVAFAPDGKRAATASADGTVKVWDISSGKNEQPLTLYHPRGLSFTSVTFSRDGKRLTASNSDGFVRVYALPIEDIVAIAKSRVTRSLTREECQKYLHVDQCPTDQ